METSDNTTSRFSFFTNIQEEILAFGEIDTHNTIFFASTTDSASCFAFSTQTGTSISGVDERVNAKDTGQVRNQAQALIVVDVRADEAYNAIKIIPKTIVENVELSAQFSSIYVLGTRVIEAASSYATFTAMRNALSNTVAGASTKDLLSTKKQTFPTVTESVTANETFIGKKYVPVALTEDVVLNAQFAAQQTFRSTVLERASNQAMVYALRNAQCVITQAVSTLDRGFAKFQPFANILQDVSSTETFVGLKYVPRSLVENASIGAQVASVPEYKTTVLNIVRTNAVSSTNIVAVCTVLQNANAKDLPQGKVRFFSSVSNSASGLDLPSAIKKMPTRIIETASSSTTFSSIPRYSGRIIERVSAKDIARNNVQFFSGVFNRVAAFGVSLKAVPTYPTTIIEPVSGVDVILGGFKYSTTVFNTSAAFAVATVFNRLRASVLQTASGNGTVASIRYRATIINERASNADSYLARFQPLAQIIENAVARETLTSIKLVPRDIIESVDAQEFMARGLVINLFEYSLASSTALANINAATSLIENAATVESYLASELYFVFAQGRVEIRDGTKAKGLWDVIDDNQLPNWQNGTDSQVPDWQLFSTTAGSPEWQLFSTTADSPDWQEESITIPSNWTNITT